MGKGPRVDCSKDEKLTQQSSKDDANINVIVDRAKRGAIIEERNRAPMYGDFTEVPTDLRECMVTIRRADELFMSLDAHVRRRFDNDPAKMLDFLNDVSNRDEAIALGLVAAPVVAAVEPTPEEPAVDAAPIAPSGAVLPKPKAPGK